MGLTLSAAAQTGDGGADDADPQGRIIARIQDRTGDDGLDDYRIEFGFFPEWAMDDKDPWTEAITTWSDWLPRARYLTKTVIDRRDADDNRRWLRSSLISVPTSASAQQDSRSDADFEDDGGEQQNLIEGRVIARYSPDSRGRLRVEFGFLPECAFETTSNTEEAVEQYGEDLLPRARYLSASMIESRRGTWLRSSVVDVPPACEPPPPPCTIEFTSPTVAVVRGEQNENSRIGSVRCDVTDELNPISVMGTPSGLTIRVVSTGPGPWNLTLSGATTADAGSYPVEITVRPAQGAPVSRSVTIRVTTGPLKPVIVNWRGYDPDEIAVLGDAPPTVENPTVVDAESRQSVSPRPGITYKVDEAAEEVCDINRNNGRIAPLTAGICLVIARSAETDEYAAGESDPVQVMITRVDPDLRWDGYGDEDLREGGDPARPREPQPRVSEARGELTYTYSATPSSICAVNSRTGDLTPHREGECDITVRSAETDKFRADDVTVTVQIESLGGPECDDIPDVGPLDPGQTSRQINLDTYCDGENLRYEARSDNTAVVSVRRIGSTLTVTADDAPTEDRTEIIVTVTDRGGRGQPTEVRFDVFVEPVLPPRVLSVNCSPSRAEVNENVTCTVRLDPNGGMPDTYSWSGGNSRGSSETYRTTFDEPGRQPVDLTVSNSAGSDRGSTTVNIIEPPPEIIRIDCSPAQPDVDGNVTCEAHLRGGDPDTYSWSDDGGGSSSGPRETTYDTSFSSSGTQAVRLTVSNTAGSDSASTRVTVTGPPMININCPSSAAVNENITCTVSNSGGAIDTYSWSDSDGGSGSSSSYRTSFSSAGTKTIRLIARNSAGSDSDSTTLIGDGGIGPIEISCPASAAVNENITCTVSNSGGAIDTYSWSDNDGGSGSSSSYRTSFSTPGTKTVSLTARNSAGSDSDSTTVTVNVEGPDITVSCPSSADVNENITCTVSNSGGAIDTYSWSDSDGGSGSSSSYRTSFSSSGTKTVSLTARNSAGSDSDSTSVTVTGPPVITVSCPASAAVNENITCTVSNSGGAIDSYSWSDSNGGSGSRSSYRTSFSSSGTKTVRLTARNSAGSGSDSTTVTIPVEKPDISVSCPSAIAVNANFTCTVSNSGGAIVTYEWSDSRGGSGSSSSYRTNFNTAGTYTVSLTASNAGGSDSDTYRSISVIRGQQRPRISISCSPSLIEEGDRTTCSVSSNSGGSIVTYEWDSSGSSSNSSSSSYHISFSSSGLKRVRLIARNTAGSDKDTTRVQVVATPPSTQYARCGSDAIRVYYFERSTYTERWLNMTWEEVAARVSGWGEHMIGHMSQSNCNSWPNGTNLTTSNWPPQP